jgi:trans-2,3-dihydro-3-hydroxyanthranilate isomerase
MRQTFKLSITRGIHQQSQIYFDGKLTNNDFDINMAVSKFIAKGEWEV